MRWIYFNDNPREAAEREAIVARIDAWWRAFEGKVDDLRAHFTPRSCGSTGRRSVLTGTGWS